MSLQEYFQEKIAMVSTTAKPGGMGAISFSHEKPYNYITRRVEMKKIEKIELTYWVSAVEGEHNYYLILQWTKTGNEERYEEHFAHAIESFEETYGDESALGGTDELPDTIRPVSPEDDGLPPGVTRE